MLYPKFPQRYLAAIVVCLILTLGFLGALFLIYLFNEGRSPLIPHNGGAGVDTTAGVVSVKLALGGQQQSQPLQQQQQQQHEARQPQKKRIYQQQPVAMLNANEDDEDDDDGNVLGGGGVVAAGLGEVGISISSSEGDVSARYQSQHGSESEYLEDEDMLNIDDDIGERQLPQQQQHFVDDNYQLQHMLGTVVDDNEESPQLQSEREQLPLKQRAQAALDEMLLRTAHVQHPALAAGVGSPELGVDDDEDGELGDDYDVSISVELWRQRKQPRRQQARHPSGDGGTLELDMHRGDKNYDTIYIDDFERPPATLKASGRGSLQRPYTAPRHELVNMEVSDINYFDAIIDGGERDGKGATIDGGTAAAAVPARATAATTLIVGGIRPLKLQNLKKPQRRKNQQQRKNRQQPQKPLRRRYSEMTAARRVLPMYYLNMLYSKHKYHSNNNNSKDRQPVSVDDEDSDDEDADAEGDEEFFVGSGSGAGALAMDGFSFRDVDTAGEEVEPIEDDIDAAETAEFIKRINSKMRQTTKNSGRYGSGGNNNNNNNHNNSYDNNYTARNCNISSNNNNAETNSIDDNKTNGNNSKNKNISKHRQKTWKKRNGCAELLPRTNSRKSSTPTVEAAVSGGKYYAHELRAQSGTGSNASTTNNSSNESSRSNAVIEAIDFYNLSSELVSNLSAPQLYQDEKFVSSMRTATAATTAATIIGTRNTVVADNETATKKSAAAAEALSLRAAAATIIKNNNKDWPAGTAAAATVTTDIKTAATATATATNRLTAPKIGEPQQSVAINAAASKLLAAASSGGDNTRGDGGTLFNSAAWLETRTRRIIGNVKKSEERSRQLLLCEEAGGGELCRMLFKGHLNE